MPLPLNPLPDVSTWPCLRTLLPKGIFSLQELSLQPDGGVPSSGLAAFLIGGSDSTMEWNQR